MSRRLLAVLFPWYVLWRIRQLSESPLIYPLEPSDTDEWQRGYERAMWEVRLNLGREDVT